MAPGVDVVSTYLDGGYAALTGTSMAAPVVSAGLALLRQMWPHLDGQQLAGILLETADKTVPGYASHVHGQGLLDMAAATSPVGTLGVPQGGTVAAQRLAPVASGAVAELGDAASAALSGVMLLDSYDRDFYLDLGAGLRPVDTRRGTSVAGAGGLTDGYAGHFNPEHHAAMKVPLARGWSLIGGAGQEQNGFLGNRLSGLLGNVTASRTAYALANYRHGFADGDTALFAQFGGGLTGLQLDPSPSLLTRAGTVASSTATLGLTRRAGGGLLGFSISRPVQIDSARMGYRIPVGRNLDGTVRHVHRTIDFRPKRRETDIGVFFRRAGWDGRMRAESFVEWRHDAPHAAGDVIIESGVRLRFTI